MIQIAKKFYRHPETREIWKAQRGYFQDTEEIVRAVESGFADRLGTARRRHERLNGKLKRILDFHADYEIRYTMRPRVYAALMASTYGYVEFLLKQLQLNVEVPADKHSGSVADQYLTRKRSPMQLIADIEKLSRAKIAHPLKLELELLTIVRDSFVHNQMYLRSAKLSRFKHLLANLCALRDTTGIGNIADTIEVTGENHLLQMTDQFLEASCTSLKFTLYRVLRLVDELLDNRQAVCDHGRSR